MSKSEILIIGQNGEDKKTPTFISVINDGKVTKLIPMEYIKVLGIYIDNQPLHAHPMLLRQMPRLSSLCAGGE